MTFGELLKTKREEAGLNVKTAAKEAGLAFGYWYELERNEASPSIKTLGQIASALDCKAADLLPDTDLVNTP